MINISLKGTFSYSVRFDIIISYLQGSWYHQWQHYLIEFIVYISLFSGSYYYPLSILSINFFCFNGFWTLFTVVICSIFILCIVPSFQFFLKSALHLNLYVVAIKCEYLYFHSFNAFTESSLCIVYNILSCFCNWRYSCWLSR